MQWQIDKRFNVIEATLIEHTIMLNAHASTLNAHTATLNEHTAILNAHTITLNEHTAILKDHTARFDRMEGQLAEILALLSGKA